MKRCLSLSTSTRVFLHTDRVTEEMREYLNASCVGALCVQLKSYDTVLAHVKEYVSQPGVKVWIGTEYTNYALYEIIKPAVHYMHVLFNCIKIISLCCGAVAA